MQTHTYIVTPTHQGLVQLETDRGYSLIDSIMDTKVFVNKEDVTETTEYEEDAQGNYQVKDRKVTADKNTITILSHVETTNMMFNLAHEKVNCFLPNIFPYSTKVLQDGKEVVNILDNFRDKGCTKIGEPQGGFQRIKSHFNRSKMYSENQITDVSNPLKTFEFSLMELMVPVEFLINAK